MLTIARDEHADSCAQGGGEDLVVRRIAAHGFDLLGSRHSLACQLVEELLCGAPLLGAESQLPLQHALELDHHDVEQHELDPTVAGLLDQSRGRPVGDQRGDKYVGVTGDAQRLSALGADLIDERLAVLRADPSLFGLLPTVGLKFAEAGELKVAPKGFAHYLALGLALGTSQGLRLGYEVVGNRYGK
jgi:hypothetical protein